MFWGLIMEPGKKYSQTVQKSFHISHAALDLDTAANDPVQVLLGFDNRNYLICTLQKGKWIQAQLDLNFREGDTVSFATNGPGHVHLTGYLIPDDEMEMDDVEEEESDEEVPELVLPSKKRKALENNKVETVPVAKKSKTAKLLDAVNEDDTDESDDSDVNLTDILDEEDGEEEEDAEDEEDENDDEEDDDDDDDDDDDEEEDESEEEEEKVEQKPSKKDSTPVKQNGLAQKQEKTPKDKTPGKKEVKTPQQNEKQQKGEKTPKGQKTPGGTPNKKTVEGGVLVEDLKMGEGQVAKPGKLVQVYYEGRLKSNNKMFDSSTKGPGFKFRLGRQEVIKGWDVGVAGMKIGGKRRITCPPNMAYGARGSPPVIPPGSTLIFEVELKNVKN